MPAVRLKVRPQSQEAQMELPDAEPRGCLRSRVEVLEIIVEGLACKIQQLSGNIADLQADKLELSQKLERQIEMQVTKKCTEISSQLDASMAQKFLGLFNAQIKRFSKAFRTFQYHFWCPAQGLVLGPGIVFLVDPQNGFWGCCKATPCQVP